MGLVIVEGRIVTDSRLLVGLLGASKGLGCYNAPFFNTGRDLVEQEHAVLQLYAGTRPDGEPVYEKAAVRALPDAGYLLLHSPGFIRGIARGDTIELVSERAGTFKVLSRGGNLAVRVYCRGDAEFPDTILTPQVTQLEGRRDIKSAHLLVYSIPAKAGFEAIESIFDQALSGSPDTSWAYGNVYDEHSGQPLNWWLQTATARNAQ